jgi:DNA repair exonuclease SbcCD ATPase subunit
MIKFKTIKWRNFLSTGAQFTEVNLSRSTTTLIVGENGAGKSTVLDAICYALFNKPFRNINKPQLINSINQKQMVVEVEFSIGTKEYKIVRGAKPNVFEIYLNDNLLNQDAASRDYQKYLEEHVLKLNYKSFTQIVILGSASFTPFMQLSAAVRREVIEDLLDIKIFSVMNDVLKEKYNDIKTKIQNLDTSIELGKQKVKLQQEYIKTLEDDKEQQKKDINILIQTSKGEITKLTTEVDVHKANVNVLKVSITDNDTQEAKDKKLKVLKDKLVDKVKAINKEIEFFKTHDQCPTCNQNIDQEFKDTVVHDHEEKRKELDVACSEIVEQLNQVEYRLEAIATIKSEITDINDIIIDLNSKIIAEQTYIRKLETDLDTTTSSTANIDEEKAALKSLAKEVVELSSQKSTLVEERHYLDVAGILLKDTGIKTKVIRQYLPVINKLVNKYLQAMDFFISFELDESFNETIKSRHRDEFSYASFSEGEKAKIDLALLFAWRAIARMKNSANTNLLLLDEVFDGSLDINGTDYVMTILNTIGEETNIFVISHKDALFDKFRSIIKFEKHQSFSRIAK